MAIIVSSDGTPARKLQPEAMEREEDLQAYIAANPDTLPLDSLKDDLKLLVLGREFHTDSGPIDVLAVDRDGELFIVETKLYRNADKRRVVAQMLDYGAAIWRGYANADVFIADAEAAVRSFSGKSLDDSVREVFGVDADESVRLIAAMRRKLLDGVFHFVVLMDRLDERLRDLILFLNRNSRFSVYAVEMEFYKHQGLQIVIPRLHGAEIQKATKAEATPDERYAWSPERFVAALKTSLEGEPAQLDAALGLFNGLRDAGASTEMKNTSFSGGECYAYFTSSKAGGERVLGLHTDGTLFLLLDKLARSKRGATVADALTRRLRDSKLVDLAKGVTTGGNEYPAAEWHLHQPALLKALREAF